MSLNHNKSLPRRHDFSYEYNGKTIEYSVWVSGHGSYVQTILFLGTVQIGKLPMWIAQECPAGTVVVQGAPHWFAKADGSDVPEFMWRYTEEAFSSIVQTHHVKGKLHVISDSQSVPGVLRLLSKDVYSSQVDSVALLQPLGLNTSAFTGTVQERTSLLKKRFAKNSRHQLVSLLTDRHLAYNHLQIIRKASNNNARSDAQYGSGLMYDSSGDLKNLRDAGTKVVIICGENDAIFPPNELQAMLDKNKLDIPLVIIPKIPHSPLATEKGRRLLNKAFEYFN